MSHSEDIRIVRMSNGTQIIGRVLGVTDVALTMDNVFNIIPISSEADYGLVPWLTGVDVSEPLDINILNMDVQAEPTEEFYEGWVEACATYQEILEEEFDEKQKASKGSLAKDEIDILLEEYEAEERKKAYH